MVSDRFSYIYLLKIFYKLLFFTLKWTGLIIFILFFILVQNFKLKNVENRANFFLLNKNIIQIDLECEYSRFQGPAQLYIGELKKGPFCPKTMLILLQTHVTTPYTDW